MAEALRVIGTSATLTEALRRQAHADLDFPVQFEVLDGLEGFPASYLDAGGPVSMKLVDGSLRIRSARAASRYLGGAPLADADGFVDTDDLVERRGGQRQDAGGSGAMAEALRRAGYRPN